MTIIISDASLAVPRIGYQNLLESAVSVTASSEASGYEVANAYDWRLDDWWKPTGTGTSYITAVFITAVSVDYFAVFGHDLHTYGGWVKLQYSTNGGVSWSDAASYVMPSDSRVIFQAFTAILANRWRVVMYSPSGPASLGIVAFGTALKFPRQLRPGFSPPTLSRQNEYMGVKSESGVFIGRSLKRRGVKFSIERDNLTPEWVREYWEPFLDHAEAKPFFFSWDYENHPWEAAYCWADDISASEYHHPMYMKVAASLMGQVEL